MCKYCGGFCVKAINMLTSSSATMQSRDSPMCEECFKAYMKHLNESEKVKLR